jgi:hypothetical protein
MLKNMFDLFQNGLYEILIYCPIKVHLTVEEKTDQQCATCSGGNVCMKSSSTIVHSDRRGEDGSAEKYVRPVPAKLYVRNLPLLSL